MYNDITGIILCGGKSSRMGVNKAFLKLGGLYLIEIISKLMRELFDKVMLITNETSLYNFLKLELYEDIYKFKGPLGGIHSGLIHSKTEKNFIISCDIPLISHEAIKFITDYPSDKNIKVPYADGYIQQLSGIYSKNSIPMIEEILNEEDNKINEKKCNVLKLIEKAKGEVINIEKEMIRYKPNMFLNMNDMNQYNIVKKLYAERIY